MFNISSKTTPALALSTVLYFVLVNRFQRCQHWKTDGMIGKGACGKWRVFPGATSWRVVRQSEVELDNSAAMWMARCYPAGQVPRIFWILLQMIQGFCEAMLTAFNRGFELRSSNLYSRYLQQHSSTWEKNETTCGEAPTPNFPHLTFRQIWGQVEYTYTKQKALWGAVSPYLQQLKWIRKGNMKKRVGYPCFTCDTTHMLLRPA